MMSRIVFLSPRIEMKCCIAGRGMRTRPMQVFIYTGPNHLAFRQIISYENGKIISAEETSAYGLQKLLYDPAPSGFRNVHNI
jgi:hypothetical protein